MSPLSSNIVKNKYKRHICGKNEHIVMPAENIPSSNNFITKFGALMLFKKYNDG